MSEGHGLFQALIKTLQEENKSKIHEIFLITQEMNKLLGLNMELKEQQSALMVVNTEQRIVIQRQQLQLRRQQQAIEGMQQVICNQEQTIRKQQQTVNDLKDKQIYHSHTLGSGREESVYNLLNTNYFEEWKEEENRQNYPTSPAKSQDESIKLRHRIIEADCEIQQLQHTIKVLQNEIHVLRGEHLAGIGQGREDAKKYQIQLDQVQSKNRYLSQNNKTLQDRNQQLSVEVKELVETRYHLERKINAMTMNLEALEKQLHHFKMRNQSLQQDLKRNSRHLHKEKAQMGALNASMSQLQSQIMKLRQENSKLSSQHSFLKTELSTILKNKVDLDSYLSLQNQNQIIRTELQIAKEKMALKDHQLLLKSEQKRLQPQLKESIAASKQEISNLISINVTLSSEVNMLRQRLAEEEIRNRQVVRLETANKSLMKRVQLLQHSMYEQKRKSSTKIESMLNIPSSPSIPSRDRVETSGERKRYNLMRIKSEQNISKDWLGREDEVKRSSRMKNIFSSRQIPTDMSIGEKSKWKTLQDRLESLKYQNEDLKRHLTFHRL